MGHLDNPGLPRSNTDVIELNWCDPSSNKSKQIRMANVHTVTLTHAHTAYGGSRKSHHTQSDDSEPKVTSIFCMVCFLSLDVRPGILRQFRESKETSSAISFVSH